MVVSLLAPLPWADPADAKSGLGSGTQLQLSAHHEYQLGNLPGVDSGDLRTVYQQLNFGIEALGLHADARTEGFRSSADGRDYSHLAQRSLSYTYDRLQATVGHFYGIVGKGLLLHAFELPGVLTEGRGTRRRYQLIRDLDGFQVEFRWRNVDVMSLRGSPVNSDLPPQLNGIDRRNGLVTGGAITADLGSDVEVGAGTLEYESGTLRERGVTVYSRVGLSRLLQSLGKGNWYADLSGEYAQLDPDAGRWFSLDRELARALYVASTVTGERWGLSLEYKNYRDFAIPSVNNPPTLIREHDTYLLNRQTHALLADDETGFQAELSSSLPHDVGLTASFNRATRRGRATEIDRHLHEYFVQVDSPLGDHQHGQLFADFARNRILENERRITAGARWEWDASAVYSAAIDMQYQDVERRFGATRFPFADLLMELEFSRFPGWNGSLQWQRSTDELETGAAESGATYWWSLGASWHYRHGQSASLFAGRRRTGLACTAGTCYEVLGFEGVELRLVNRIL